MANYRLKLSDGVTTIDLYQGAGVRVKAGGLDLQLPRANVDILTSEWADNPKLAAVNYEQRDITCTVHLQGATATTLKTVIREILRLLTDAEAYNLTGYGSKVYLEYQWGDTDGQSIYFDVLRGELGLPRDFLTRPLENGYILNAPLKLTCKPFGRYTNQDVAPATLNNFQSAYDYNLGYLTGYDTPDSVFGVNWKAQTFTPGADINLRKVALYLGVAGVPAATTLGVYATAAGLPTGAPMATATVTLTSLSALGAVWVTATFAANVALSSGVVYALVLSCPTGGAGTCPRWGYDSGGATYAGGERCTSGDSGATWAAGAGTDFLFAVLTSEAQVNYQDVTTDESYGDVPAKLYQKLVPSGAAGSAKTWIAKRSGSRQTDDLWIEGEEVTAFTDIQAKPNMVFEYLPESGLAGGIALRSIYIRQVPATNTTGDYARLDFDIATPPRGAYRVLMRCRVTHTTPANFAEMKWGLGYVYGGLTKAPAIAAGEYYINTANNTWDILDLGLLSIPPIAESEIVTNGAFQLRVHCYESLALGPIPPVYWDLDWIFLLPIDEGVAIIGSVVNTGRIAMDGITDPPNIFILDSSDLVSTFPDYVGYPFKLGRKSTRIYVLRADAKTVTHESTLKYQPGFVLI